MNQGNVIITTYASGRNINIKLSSTAATQDWGGFLKVSTINCAHTGGFYKERQKGFITISWVGVDRRKNTPLILRSYQSGPRQRERRRPPATASEPTAHLLHRLTGRRWRPPSNNMHQTKVGAGWGCEEPWCQHAILKMSSLGALPPQSCSSNRPVVLYDPPTLPTATGKLGVGGRS